MTLPMIVIREEWVGARKALLATEKELTRRPSYLLRDGDRVLHTCRAARPDFAG